MSRTGKCHNFEHCVRAYRNETITLGENDEPVCPECGQPLKLGKGRGGCLVPIILSVVVVFGVVLGVIAGFFYLQSKRLGSPTVEEIETVVVEGEGETVTAEPTPMESPVESPVESPGAALPDEEEAGEVAVPKNIDLDAGNAQNRAVKEEVLKRIDLMPTISADNKDQLYMSVERARQMGEIIKIPFGFGQRTLALGDVEKLRSALASPQIRSLMADPTAVFVILGFADTKGDPDKNLKISNDRAEVVLETLRDELGVLNVMHAIGMGGSTMFDEEGLEKNRVVEVWAVLP